MSERDDIEAMQADLGSLKEKMRAEMKRWKGLAEAEESALQKALYFRRANAYFQLLGALDEWHGKATDKLHELFPEFASDIQQMGPGGR